MGRKQAHCGAGATEHWDAFKKILDDAANARGVPPAVALGFRLLSGGEMPSAAISQAKSLATAMAEHAVAVSNGSETQKLRPRGSPLATFMARMSVLGRGVGGQGFQGVVPGAVQSLANGLGGVAQEGAEAQTIAWLTGQMVSWAVHEGPRPSPDDSIPDRQWEASVAATRSDDGKYLDNDYLNDIFDSIPTVASLAVLRAEDRGTNPLPGCGWQNSKRSAQNPS